MSNYTTLSWHNEHALTSFPFQTPNEFESLFVDAAFVQFDNFIPRLKNIKFSDDYLRLIILFDSGEITGQLSKNSPNPHLRFYENASRFLGVVTFGSGLLDFWEKYLGQEIKIDLSFNAHLVRSIPLKDAVYTLDGLYGVIKFDSLDDSSTAITMPGGNINTVSTGKTVFYNLDALNENITFNAVKNHHIYSSSKTIKPLKKINLVKPVDNNIYLSSNDVVKFNSLNNKRLEVSVAGISTGALNLPTLSS
jgi:hypothetical protein